MSNDSLVKQKLLTQLRNAMKTLGHRVVDKSSATKPCYLLYRNNTASASGVLIFKRGDVRRFVSDVKRHLKITEQQWSAAEPTPSVSSTIQSDSLAKSMWWQNGQYE